MYLEIKTSIPGFLFKCVMCGSEICGAHVSFCKQGLICGTCFEDTVLNYQQEKSRYLSREYLKALRDIKAALIGLEMDFRKIDCSWRSNLIKDAIVNVGRALGPAEATLEKT